MTKWICLDVRKGSSSTSEPVDSVCIHHLWQLVTHNAVGFTGTEEAPRIKVLEVTCFLEAFSSPAYLQRQFQFSWEIQRGPWQTGMKLARLYIQIVKTFSGLSLETWVHYKGFKTKEGKGSQRGMGQKETEQGTVRASHGASASDISRETAEWKVLLLEIKVKAEIKTYKWVKDK